MGCGMSEELQSKIAHLQMIQGVISRMAADIQIYRTMAITIAAGVIALDRSVSGNSSPVVLAAFGTTLLFWGLTAYQLHIERAYRALYDEVRKDGVSELFVMDWRLFQNRVHPWYRLAVGKTSLPFLGVLIILAFFLTVD